MSSKKQVQKLEVTDYKKICQVKDFSDYKKGRLQENSFYIVKKPEILKLIPPQNSPLGQKIPKKCSTQEFYLASINHALCMENQIILYNNKLLPDSFRHYGLLSAHRSLRYNGTTNSFNLTKKKKEKISWLPGDSLFLSGEFSEEYGHFLLEVVSRLWIMDFIDTSQFKFIMNPSDNQLWQLDFLKALGIKEKQIVYLHQPTICERLHIPVQSFVLRKYTSTLAHKTWKKIGDYYDTGVGPEKIYVSRSKLKNKRRLLVNEVEVEELFHSLGFHIIHPQELSLSNQINYFRNAKFIAGPSGSAMYNCVFEKKSVKKLILASETFFKMNDIFINTSTKGQLSYFIGKTIDANKPAVRAEWLVQLGKLKKLLKEFD
ncbi:glycosyltransferase family 61 protein [Halalkalibacter lacteus]|uniref:glycosyltransferase family 61 protein n=1 Tax=Halalkalibacter lacteus TaxID=3090663 RepID=UPI002FCAE5E3